MLWAAAAASSAAFINPTGTFENSVYDKFYLDQINALKHFLSDVQLDGLPRPPVTAPVDVLPKDSYLVIESLVGYDRLVWLYKKVPGKSQAKMVFRSNRVLRI